MANIGWVGLGRLGLPCALALQHHGAHDVLGYDIHQDRVEAILAAGGDNGEQGLAELIGRGSLKLADSVAAVVAHADVVFVAVQTPHAPKYGGETPVPYETRDFEYGFLIQAVRDVCEAAREQGKQITLVVVSTVLPGTTNAHLRGLLNGWVTLVYSPLFIAMGTTIHDFLDPEFVLMGADRAEHAVPVLEVYAAVHDRQSYVTSVDSAEFIKVAYNTFISMKIVWANTIMEICHKTGADCDAVVDALSLATDRIISPAYMRGGMGDGGHCFPPGEIVITEQGPRPIEDIKVGDLVLTFDGSLQPVLKTWQRHYEGELVGVQASGLPEVLMTADHPVMARKDLRPRRTNGRKRTDIFPRGDVTEVAASELTQDHLVRWPTHEVRDYELPDHVTPEYLELAGWYLSEGSAELTERRGRLQWSLHARESKEGERIAELAMICAPPRTSRRGSSAAVTTTVDHNRRIVRFGSKGLAELLVADFGKGARDKRLPAWALWGEEKTAALLLEGMLKGDGHIHAKGVAYSTISPDLAWGAHLLMTRLGCHPALRVIPERPGHQLSYEVRVRNRREARELFEQVNITARPEGEHEVRTDEWRAVRALRTEHYSGPVHNLWVAGTNTYVVGCGAVHNCHPRDLIALADLSRKLEVSGNLFGYLAGARDEQSAWLADLVQGWAELTGLRITVLGKAYKPGTALTGGSPALLLVDQLASRGLGVFHWDPLVDGPTIGGVDRLSDPTPLGPGVYVLATKHPQFAGIAWEAGTVVIDPFGYIPDQPGVTVIRIGRKS